MTEPHVKDEIPELCKQTFVSTRTGLCVIWTAILLMLSGLGVAVGWALTTTQAITKIESTQSILQDQINKKLDILLSCNAEKPCISKITETKNIK